MTRPATNATTIVRDVTLDVSTMPASSSCLTLSPNHEAMTKAPADRHQCEECGFEQNLCEEATTRRAERGSDRKLAAALRAADEEQCRRVREPDDQDEEGHGAERPGNPPLDRCHLAAADADEHDTALDRCRRLFRRRGVRTGFDARQKADDVAEGVEIPSWHVTHRNRHRYPDVHSRRAVAAEASGHDANDVVIDAVDGNAAADDPRIAAECGAPEAVADDGGLTRRAVVIG